MDATETFSRQPAALEIGGRRFFIARPTPRDMLAVNERMKALARAKCKSPLDYALSHGHLNGAAMELAVAMALKLGAGNGVRPDQEAVWDEFSTLEGVQWRVWYHASRTHKDLKLEEVGELVTDDNLFDVAGALDGALKLASLDPKEEPPATGSSS